jgi:hypothetical protein
MVVAAVAAIISYWHMCELAELHGESWRAALLPLAVDGMLLASTLTIVSQRRHRLPAGWVPWLGLALGILASLAANVAAARPELIAQLIAAWPPVALAISLETLVVVLRSEQHVSTHISPSSLREEGDISSRREEISHEQHQDQPGVTKLNDPVADHTTSCNPGDPVVELLEQGAGRRRIAEALNISEHAARKLVQAARNGDGP